MPNYSKLRGRIVEKYGNASNFAKALGKTPQTVSNKLNGNIGIPPKEIQQWSELLDIAQGDIGYYFFTTKG